MKDKKPVELHNYTIKIYEKVPEATFSWQDGEGEVNISDEAKIFEISVSIPKMTFRFLRALLELMEKYDRR